MNFTSYRCYPLKTTVFRSLLFILTLTALSSCIPNRKFVLLQEHEKLKQDTTNIFSEQKYRLQPGDAIQLDIKFLDGNDQFRALFVSLNTQNSQIQQGGGDFYYLNGYSLDDSGNIKLPLLGNIYLRGKTIIESQNEIEAVLRTYVSNAFVTARLGGIRFSVLGEVNRPGKYAVFQSKVTMLEALATAGDFNIVAKRDNVILVRQYPDGSRIHTLNFLEASLINSPYYYLQPNDMIYVEPLKVRALGTGYQGIQTFTTLISVISSTLVIITLFRR